MSGRSVLVTGAGSGIGAATARAFADEGDRVALLDRDGSAARARAGELEARGARVLAIEGDVTRPDDCQAVVRRLRGAWGGIDVLVASAGITQVGRALDTDEAVLRRVFEVNFFGAVHCALAALPSLLERRGRIVVISSVAGFAPLATRSGYAASKHALHGFFDSLRAEHRGDGLGVTLVCPYYVRTSIGEHALGPHGELGGLRNGVGREIEPERVANAIVRGVARERDLLLVPGRSHLAWWISRLAPGLYERLMLRQLRAGADRGEARAET